METTSGPSRTPHATFDGGDLNCGNGLLLLIRKHIDLLERGQLLEFFSTDPSVEEDLPSWCRLTANLLVESGRGGGRRRFLICKGSPGERASPASGAARAAAEKIAARGAVPVRIPDRLPDPAPAPAIPAMGVLGIGSWPRPLWMRRALQERAEGKLGEAAFQETADDAVRLCIEAQLRAGVDAVTDGEQRRDSYASFVGGLLDNCQLIPLTDILPLVDHPEELEREMRALEVPAESTRHPVVFGLLGRSRPLAVHELQFARGLTALPVKVALPGPYLLARTLWLECLSDRAYEDREGLAADIVRVLREELFHLLAEGAALVQFDEPVITEVVFTGPKNRRSFMCGALSPRGDAGRELAFARDLLNAVVAGAPADRTAIHVCRGNWTASEAAALSGDYRPLVDHLRQLRVGTYFLELCTPRAGELEPLRALPEDRRIGVGVVNQKLGSAGDAAALTVRIRRAAEVFGKERLLLNPDCGFATFSESPVSTAGQAEAMLAAIAEAARRVR